MLAILPLLAIVCVQTARISSAQPPNPVAFQVVEFEVQTGSAYSNPFDPNVVSVDGIFSTRNGPKIAVPAFWDGDDFKLRFNPPHAGAWDLRVLVHAGAGEPTEQSQTHFRVRTSRDPGFVRVSPANGRYLEFDNGKSFMPIGLNICWPDKTGLESYDRRFAKLKSVGGNFVRIWTTQERRLETTEAGLGRYDLKSAAYYDDIFRLAGKYGIRTMLTFDDYRVLAKTDYFNAHWDSSPYNSANGGPLKNPTDFFQDPLCRRLYKQRLRYLVARYSAFTSLAAWELYNEQDNIPKPGVPTSWFREMTDYLASIDPYHHLITTSYSWDDKPEVWQSPALSLTQRHMYGQGDTVDFVSMIEGNARKMDPYGKPRLIGEFGITWKEPDLALDKAKKGTPLHDALWASIMTGDSGGALTWWWDNYLEPANLWDVFVGISKFVAPIDFAHSHFRPIQVSMPGLTVLALEDASTGDTLVWIHDPASNWKNDAAGIEPKECGGTIVLPGNGDRCAQFWDTRTGKMLTAELGHTKDGTYALLVPDFKRDIALRVTHP